MQTPIQKAISELEESIKAIDIQFYSSDNDLITKKSYEYVLERIQSLLPYEQSFLKKVEGEAWDAADKRIEEVQEYRYGRTGGYQNPDKQTYLETKYPNP